MNERQKILKKFKKREGKDFPSHYFPDVHHTEEELINLFLSNLSRGGGFGEFVRKDSLLPGLRSIIRESDNVMNLSGFPFPDEKWNRKNTTISENDTVDVLILKGELGVGENGAIWITDGQLVERRLPFIATRIVIIITKDKLVSDLVYAYQQIDLTSLGFGVWIAGPSKTADIEQSLVIGAQGATHHTVFITD
jgi:L-lactate dehydrogenase complex protein LldG